MLPAPAQSHPAEKRLQDLNQRANAVVDQAGGRTPESAARSGRRRESRSIFKRLTDKGFGFIDSGTGKDSSTSRTFKEFSWNRLTRVSASRTPKGVGPRGH